MVRCFLFFLLIVEGAQGATGVRLLLGLTDKSETKWDPYLRTQVANSETKWDGAVTARGAPSTGKRSYYYVRGEQENGEIVWVSPLWITYTGK